MQAENGLHIVFFEDSGFAQIPGTAGGLLRRLEYQQHIVGQAFLFAQAARQLQKNCHVSVVTAGVHFAGVDGCILPGAAFADGQGIGFRPEGDGLFRAKVKPGAQSPGHGGKYGAVQPLQPGCKIGDGFRNLPVKLRNPVQGAAIFCQGHLAQPPKIKFSLIIAYSAASVNFPLRYGKKGGMMMEQNRKGERQ